MHIDLIIIGIFLVLTLAIGLYCSKEVTTFRDYAVGNKKINNFVIAISIIATVYGGRSLFLLDSFYSNGFYLLNFSLFYGVGLWLVSRFMILRMKEFAGHLSIAESMGNLYGPAVRMITGIAGIMVNIFMLIFQFKVGLHITTTMWPEIEQLSTHLSITLALLTIGYSTFGGARAVVLTDVYQFFLFAICFPILIFTCLYYIKNPLAGWQKLTNIPQFNISETLKLNNNLEHILDALIAALCHSFYPAWIQRFYMGSSVQQSAKGFYKASIIQLILTILFLTTVGALCLGGHDTKNNQHIIDYLVKFYYFPGMLGMLITAIIALLMSSADSFLHVASVLFTNDVLPVVMGSSKWITKYPLRIARISSAIIGLISIFIMLYVTDFLQLRVYIMTYYSTLSILLILAILGFRTSVTTSLLSIGMNTSMILYSVYCFYYKANDLSNRILNLSFLFSVISLLGIHYLLPKRHNTGWIGIKDRSPLDLQNQETKRWWLRRLQNCKLSFTKAYWKNCFPKKIRTFILLGSYSIISTFIALCYMQKSYFSLYAYWYILALTLGTSLIVYPSFHSYKPTGHPILHWAWPLLLFLLLFVSNIQFAKLGHFRPMVFALFISNLALGIVLLSFKIGLTMLSIAMILHKFIPPHIDFCLSFWPTHNKIFIELVLATTLLTATLVGFGIYKYLRDKIDIKLKTIALARHYERRAALEMIYNQVNWSKLNPIYSNKMLQEMRKILQAPCSYLYTHGQAQLGGEINRFMKQLGKFSNLLLKRVKEERILTLNKKEVQPVAIDLAISQAHNTTLRLGEPIALLIRNQTKVTHLIADLTLFERLLTVNLFEISKSKQTADHMVTLTIADTVLRYDYENAIQSSKTALTLPAIAFFISTDATVQNIQRIYDITNDAPYTHLPKSENQLYQAESRQIVQAHGGYETIIETKEVLTYCYVLPVHGQKVMRFKTYDPTVLSHKTNETAESLAQEKELVTLLTLETTLSKEMIETTITFIKNAHGLVTRKSGAPYYTHPMAVAKILLEVTKDPTTILAGLLHDVVEDTPIPLTQVELMYGPEVAYIVDMVTHYNTSGYRWKLDDRENKNLLNQCKDIRVVEVKLADRLHNIRTLHFRKLVDQKRIAKETMTFYIPWGKKNNISKWVLEMSDICEEILNKKG